jgi:hypothetical protein
MISFVLVTRNDNYEGNPIERLRQSLNINLTNLNKYFENYQDEFEFMIGDWGSDDIITKKNLGVENNNSVKIVSFPKEITNLFDTSFNEVHSLNFLIRNSKKKYVARLDQDIILGEKFLSYLRNNILHEDKIYWSTRRDLQPDFDGCDLNKNTLNYDPNQEEFYKAAIGIVMSHKKNWLKIKGYNEKNIYRNHMEHDLYKRFINLLGSTNLVNLGITLDSDFYHINHSRNDGLSRKMNELDQQFDNDENWGLENLKTKIRIYE